MGHEQRLTFDRRLKRVARRHRGMARGAYVASVAHDGLIIARPRRRDRSGVLRALLAIVLVAFAVKVLFLATLGEAAYLERLAVLEAGTAYERIAARALAIDPITARAVDLARSFAAAAP